jgi:alkaline phosphatase D
MVLRVKWIFASLLISVAAMGQTVDRVAFGSCNKQDQPQPLWTAITAFQPQLWIWLGDNIYGDTEDMAVLDAKWKTQKENPDYTALRQSATILGTWDDHDYGVNNGDKTYAKKSESAKRILDFLDVPADSPRRQREGIYDTQVFGEPGRQVRVILLDVRTHRDAPDTDGDILGEAQWTWLEKVLAESRADLHIFCSGTQILSAEHRHEKWAEYPRSRERILQLASRVSGPVFLSGDRHISEISRLNTPPILEITSSGLTHFWKNFPGEPNALRIGEVYANLSFGTLEIDWPAKIITASLRDANGEVVHSVKQPF